MRNTMNLSISFDIMSNMEVKKRVVELKAEPAKGGLVNREHPVVAKGFVDTRTEVQKASDRVVLDPELCFDDFVPHYPRHE